MNKLKTFAIVMVMLFATTCNNEQTSVASSNVTSQQSSSTLSSAASTNSTSIIQSASANSSKVISSHASSANAISKSSSKAVTSSASTVSVLSASSSVTSNPPENTEIKFSYSMIYPINYHEYEDTAEIDTLVLDLVSKLDYLVKVDQNEITQAIKSLILMNPVYTPQQAVQKLKINFKGFKTDPNGWAYYSNIDQYIYIGEQVSSSKNLSMALAHELTHALSCTNGMTSFSYSIKEKIQGQSWGNRISEGLTDLYAFSAMKGKLENTSFGEYGNIKNYWYINSPYVYPYEQTAALIFCNALGRDMVSKAYYSEAEFYLSLENYYKTLTGKDFITFLGSAERFVAHSCTYKDLNREAATAASKEYMDLILEVCTARAKNSPNEACIEELQNLIDYTPTIYDEIYIKNYKSTLSSLIKSISIK